MFSILIVALFVNLGHSSVLFRNPEGLNKIAAGLNELIRIAWTVEPRDKTYLRSHLIFRKAEKSCIIMAFDQEIATNFSNIFESEISSMGPTFVTLNLKSNILEGAIISVENLYKDSSEVIKVEVYDYLPIYIVHPPDISCGDVIISYESLVSFECTINSKPEPFVSFGFQKIPRKYDVEKKLLKDTTLNYKVLVRVSFQMSALYLGKKIYVSASTGSFDTFKELVIPLKTFPLNVQLYFDEKTSSLIEFKSYTNSIKNIYLRCSASSHDKDISYTIHGPNNLKISNETFTVDKLSEINHSGQWYCTAKNKFGEVTSPKIRVLLHKGVPERPEVSVQGLKSKNNVFTVNSKNSFTVSCSSRAYPEAVVYQLQMINSGMEHKKEYSKTGKFVLNYDQHFTENIFSCTATNLLGQSLPVVLNIQDTHNTGWFKRKSSFLQSSFITAICILSVFLLVMVLYIAIKLKRSSDARHLLWQIFRCRLCTTLAPIRQQNGDEILGTCDEEQPIYNPSDRYLNGRNLFSDLELEHRYIPRFELSGDDEETHVK